MVHTITTAGQELKVPPTTIRGWEERGIVGPFQRDATGRRLLHDKDIAAIRRHLKTKAAA